MNISKKSIFKALFVTTICALQMPVLAQEYPSKKAIQLISNGPVGSSSDIVARLLADELGTRLNQRIVVEAKPTANGALAGEAVARANADGYTLLFSSTSSMVINPHLNKNLSWNPLKDFTPITEIGVTANVIAVAGDSKFNSFKELVAATRQKPGQIKLGVFNLTLGHFMALALKQTANIDFQIIPFSQQAQMITALISHDIDVMTTAAGSLLPMISSGRMKALAVSSDQRLQTLPDVPPIRDFAPSFSAANWFGLYTTAGTDAKVVQRLQTAINDLLQSPKFKGQLMTAGTIATGGTGAAFHKRMESDLARYGDIVTKAKLTIQ